MNRIHFIKFSNIACMILMIGSMPSALAFAENTKPGVSSHIFYVSTERMVASNDVKSLISGNTIQLRIPVYENGAISRYGTQHLYFRENGSAYSTVYSNVAWTINDSRVCLRSNPQNICLEFLSDASGKRYVRGPTGVVSTIESVTAGDSQNFRQQYIASQERRENEIKQKIISEMLQGAVRDGLSRNLRAPTYGERAEMR